MRALRLAGVVIAIGLGGLSACGEDPEPLLEPARPADPAILVATWEAVRPGYRLRYVFRPDGTYSHVSANEHERRRGTYRFVTTARGRYEVRGRTLEVRPRSGRVRRHDPEDPKNDFNRPIDRTPQRFGWFVVGEGEKARLTLTLGTISLTYRRR